MSLGTCGEHTYQTHSLWVPSAVFLVPPVHVVQNEILRFRNATFHRSLHTFLIQDI